MFPSVCVCMEHLKYLSSLSPPPPPHTLLKHHPQTRIAQFPPAIERTGLLCMFVCMLNCIVQQRFSSPHRSNKDAHGAQIEFIISYMRNDHLCEISFLSNNWLLVAAKIKAHDNKNNKRQQKKKRASNALH